MNTTELSSLTSLNPVSKNNSNLQVWQNGENEKIKDVASTISCAIATTYFFMNCCSLCQCTSFRLHSNYEIIVTDFGIPVEILREPGLYTLTGFQLDTLEIYIGLLRGKLKKISVNDKNGFPCTLSAVYNFRIVNAIEAHYKTPDYSLFISKMAHTALQKFFNEVSYDSISCNLNQKKIITLLQSYVENIGIKVSSFMITTISVSEKMQKLLLKKQEAQSYVDARKTLAKASVSNLESTLEKLEKTNIKLSKTEKNALVTQTIYMSCQGEDFTLRLMPTVTSDIEAMQLNLCQNHNTHKKQKEIKK